MAQKYVTLHQLEAAANAVPPNLEAVRVALGGVGVELKKVDDKSNFLKQVAGLALQISAQVEGDEQAEFTAHATAMNMIADAFTQNTQKTPTQTEAKNMTSSKSANPAT